MTDSLVALPLTESSRSSIPRPEYPRPYFDRSHSWQSLNGVWDFARDGGHVVSAPALEDWTEKILVPFAWETEASGVEAQWLDRAWYGREFTIAPEVAAGRIILHFGAVQHSCTIWIDDTNIGSHAGGYVPFEFDITDALAFGPTHTLTVRVDAPIDKRYIAHGKQRSVPRDDYDGCSFTPTSGIWQSVWLEGRPATYLATLGLTPTADLDGILVRATISGPSATGATARIALDGVDAISVDRSALDSGVVVGIPSPRLWSPEDPHRYSVTVTVMSDDGVDTVTGETGLRRFEARRRELYLNGKRISMRGVLDQGYWPRTGLTAPADEAFVRDLEIARDAGFNLVRKHLKLEDPRFLYHADRLGMLVWAEPASTGRFSTEAAAAFADQIEPMFRRDGNHPSIVIWGLYNEEWGLDWALPDDPAKQEAVRDAFRLMKRLDPQRPAVDNSGWTHLETDLVDWHVYDEKPAGWARKVQHLVVDPSPRFPVAIAVDAIVDKRLMVKGEVPQDVPFVNSEFGGGYTSIERGWNLHWQTQELRRHDSIAGYVWTELTDIEHETAGIVDFERHLRDHGGRPAAHANAETVTVFDVIPIEPGRDLIASDGVADFRVAVSHHGAAPIDVTVRAAWGPIFGEEPTTPTERVGTVHVEPFRLSQTVAVNMPMPPASTAARLHVLLTDATGVVGRGSVDVSRD
ncbi:glycoside hydrolase family 2 protein [Leifsonia sp. 2MCAF36]|uniref:glycoside hydrolase family 2 protein n=1 Tax=Leifsonia sp. 2MCAF36 TaxID=3232988 RepID=UPI003F979A39